MHLRTHTHAVCQYLILSIESNSSSSFSSATVSEIISFLPLWLTGSLLVLLSALALYLRQLSSPLWNCVLRTAEPNGNYWIRGSLCITTISSHTLSGSSAFQLCVNRPSTSIYYNGKDKVAASRTVFAKYHLVFSLCLSRPLRRESFPQCVSICSCMGKWVLVSTVDIISSGHMKARSLSLSHSHTHTHTHTHTDVHRGVFSVLGSSAIGSVDFAIDSGVGMGIVYILSILIRYLSIQLSILLSIIWCKHKGCKKMLNISSYFITAVYKCLQSNRKRRIKHFF